MLEKKKALLIAFIFAAQLLIAQEVNSPVGYFVDHNGNEITGFTDLDYSGDKFLYLSYHTSQNFVSGYYIDKSDQKTEGFLKVPGLSTKAFWYKKALTDKATRVPKGNVRSAKTEVDSLVVSRVSQGKVVFPNRTLSKVFDLENITIYVASHAYYIDVDSSRLIEVPQEGERFTKNITPYFNDYTILSQRITNGNFGPSKFIQFARTAQLEEKHRKKQKIYFSRDWSEKDEFVAGGGYGLVLAIKDTILTIHHFDNSGKLILEGNYSSLSPVRKEGSFKWYYPNGNLRKSGSYKENTPSRSFREYFESGQLHRKYKLMDGERIYDQVYGENGDKLLVNGNGIEEFQDVFFKVPRKLIRSYENGKLVASRFTESGKNIYQLADVSPRLIKSVATRLELLDYPTSEGSKGREGTVYARLLIRADGKLQGYSILPSSTEELREGAEEILITLKSLKGFRPGKLGKEKVPFEIVVTLSFQIEGGSRVRWNNYNYHWFDHNLHMDMFMNQPVNLPTPPSRF